MNTQTLNTQTAHFATPASPVLLAGVVATREVFGGAGLSETLGWVRILAAFDLVFVAGGVLLFEPLMAD